MSVLIVSSGYLAIYSSSDSLHFIKECLKQIEEYESLNHTALPLIVLLANEAGTPESKIHFLRNEGNNLANKYAYKSFLYFPMFPISSRNFFLNFAFLFSSLQCIFPKLKTL